MRAGGCLCGDAHPAVEYMTLELRGKVRARGRAIGSVCKQVLIQVLSVDELGGEGVRSETGQEAQNRALRDRLRILHSQLRVDREVIGKPGTGVVLEACGRELSEIEEE